MLPNQTSLNLNMSEAKDDVGPREWKNGNLDAADINKTVQSRHPLRARATTRTFVRPLVANAMFLGLRLPISEFKRKQACNSAQPIFATLKSFGNAFSS